MKPNDPPPSASSSAPERALYDAFDKAEPFADHAGQAPFNFDAAFDRSGAQEPAQPVFEEAESEMGPLPALTPTGTLSERESFRTEGCVLIGPTGAGKTCLMAALHAACYTDPIDPERTLSVVNPDVDAEDRLARYTVDWIGSGSAPPVTEQLRRYELEIAAQVEGGLLRPTERTITTIRCADGPGGALFRGRADFGAERVKRELRAELIRQAADASRLVLVFDSQNPTVDLVEMNLSPLLDRLARPADDETFAQSWPVRMLTQLGVMRPQEIGRRSMLKASRVLLLLSKIDAVAQAYADRLAAHGLWTTPLAVAEVLDPVALALDRLGERPLRRIMRVLNDRAEFAIGVVSATGFVREDGQSFHTWTHGRDVDDRLRNWRPFGIQEALLFLTTGRCVGSVRRISSDRELSIQSVAELPEFPFRTVHP